MEQFEQKPVPEIGALSNLNTTEKSSLVGAVNEINSKLTTIQTKLPKLETIKYTELNGRTDDYGNVLIGASPQIDGKSTIVLCFCRFPNTSYDGVYTPFWNGVNWYIHVSNWNGQPVTQQNIQGNYYYGTFSTN